MSFERGFRRGCELFEQGLTLELITHRAEGEGALGRGMVAAVEAMSGWLDLARREAKAHGVSEPLTEELLRLARGVPHGGA